MLTRFVRWLRQWWAGPRTEDELPIGMPIGAEVMRRVLVTFDAPYSEGSVGLLAGFAYFSARTQNCPWLSLHLGNLMGPSALFRAISDNRESRTLYIQHMDCALKFSGALLTSIGPGMAAIPDSKGGKMEYRYDAIFVGKNLEEVPCPTPTAAS